MHICFLSSAHPKLDKRVFAKEAVCLAQAGFQVTHLAPDEQAGQEERQGVSISTYQRSSGLVGRLMALPALYRRAAALKADAYHANEFDSWLVAMALKWRRKSLAIFDVHEFYVSGFADTRFSGPVAAVVTALLKWTYKVFAPRTDAIILANRYIRQEFEGIDGNYVLVENFGTPALQGARDSAESRRQVGEPFRLVHVGLLSRDRGSMHMLDLVRQIDDPALKLDLIGKTVDMSNAEMKAEIDARGLADAVSIVDWLPVDELYARLNSADAGIILFMGDSTTNIYGLPHKLFDYMGAALPVLTLRNSRYIASIVEEQEAGLVVDGEAASGLSEAVKKLMNDPAEAARLGANGRKAVTERYNWDREAERLVELYHDLAGRIGKSTR